MVIEKKYYDIAQRELEEMTKRKLMTRKSANGQKKRLLEE